MNREELIARYSEPTKIGPHGHVRLIDVMGDDAAIVQAARVSYGKGTKTINEDTGLIRYLLRNKHTSPIEMCEIKLHVKMPIHVARQWIRLTNCVADIKLCELLEHPEADNQQPSLESDLLEGPTTSENGLSETMSHHERRAKCTKFLNCKGCKNYRGF